MKTFWIIISLLALIVIIYAIYTKNKISKIVEIKPEIPAPVPQIKRTVQRNTTFNQDYLNSFGNPELIRQNPHYWIAIKGPSQNRIKK